MARAGASIWYTYKSLLHSVAFLLCQAVGTLADILFMYPGVFKLKKN